MILGFYNKKINLLLNLFEKYTLNNVISILIYKKLTFIY
jgi:hypothetical protein